MDLTFNSEDEAFRAEVQAFIGEAYTDDLKQRMALSRNGSIGKDAIHIFAREHGIAPGIVVGQLQHLGYLPYTHCNGLKRTFVWATEGG